MLQFFRNMFKSKIGLAFVFAFIALIAVAFASADISGTANLGGGSAGDRVAVVGDTRIGPGELQQAAQDAFDRERAQDPTLTMQAFIARGGLNQAMDALIDRAALGEYAREHGLRAGDNLVNSEIRKIPAFRGTDGNFSETTYRQVLAAQRLTDAQVRADLATGLYAQQLLLPATVGTVLPQGPARRYAQLFKERRQGAVATFPAGAFAPKGEPTAAQLSAFYAANTSLFVRPERRVIRYAVFDAAVLGASAEPTAAEIAARYRQNAAQYAARETRSFTQLIVPTEAAAKAIRAKVAAGSSLEAAGQGSGLRTAALTDIAREALRSQASAAVADAYFSAARGAVTAPVRSPLGWHIARVDSVVATPARSLAQATPEITTALRAEKRDKGLADYAARIEEQLDGGANLGDIAREFRLPLQTTKPLVATGQVYGSLNERVPEAVAPALQSAFQMEEEEAQVAPLPAGGSYLVYDVSDITPSAAAPLAEVREPAINAWRQIEGAKAARAAADRVLAQMARGTSLGDAVASLNATGVQTAPVNMTREELARMGGQRIPPAFALFFSMAQGTEKKLELPGRSGWAVVALDRIAVDPIADNDPLIAQARAQLGQVQGNEYADQLRLALRKAVGVERNAAAIEAVRKQLLGQN